MRLTKGKEYRIRFSDHVKDGNESIVFTITGRVIKSGRSDVVVSPWFYGDNRDFDLTDQNVERFTIVRRAIQSAEEI